MKPDPYKYFRVEAREILEQLGKGVLELEKTPGPEVVQRLLRHAHTLKGAARVVRQKEIAEQAHAMEDALAGFREGAAAVPRGRVDALLQLLDAIGARVAALGAPPAARDGGSAEPGAAAGDAFRTLRADVSEMDALIDGVAEAHAQLAAVRRGLAAIAGVRRLHELLVDQIRSPRAQRAGEGAGARALAISEEIGELLAGMEDDATSAVEHVDRELRQVRETAERLRLLPVGLTFNVLERAVRDASQSVGRPVAFETRGGDVRLDAHVLEVVQSALVQLVRNAVAHGVEGEAERRAAGKPREGQVVLEVARRGGRVSFACRDDGRGVDVEAVRQAARRKGALPAQVDALGPEEVIGLLLRGGLSTSGTITSVSGRGIGLDVVRDATSRLGGEVTVRTEPGRGTTVEVLVPVSLASMDALLVETGAQTAVIPLDAVRRTMRVSPAGVAHTAEGDSIVVDDRVIPFMPLARALGVHAGVAAARQAWSAVVVESGAALAALGVDRLLGTGNVVLRPLPGLCPAEPVVAGVSLDSEGNPQLALDPEVLVASARRAPGATQAAPAHRPPILVIDDSLTTRMLEQSILESAGYQVDLAISGEEALAKARQRRYALFLVDVEMPGMDGFEFIQRVRGDPGQRDIPAILVTSRSAPEDRRRGEEAGAAAYIVKSDFDQTDLLERIRTLVGGR